MHGALTSIMEMGIYFDMPGHTRCKLVDRWRREERRVLQACGVEIGESMIDRWRVIWPKRKYNRSPTVRCSTADRFEFRAHNAASGERLSIRGGRRDWSRRKAQVGSSLAIDRALPTLPTGRAATRPERRRRNPPRERGRCGNPRRRRDGLREIDRRWKIIDAVTGEGKLLGRWRWSGSFSVWIQEDYQYGICKEGSTAPEGLWGFF
jgi:hypothetical protein